MVTTEELEDRLRRRVITGIHAGTLRPGDALPSIRATSAELDADHRTVSRAYRRLELEGLVEIRPRSGVYVASQERLDTDGLLLSATAGWVAEILVEGWNRGIPFGELSAVVNRCTNSVELRCGCVDDVVDAREALVEETREQFGLVPEPIALDGGGSTGSLGDDVEGMDLLLTSAFHAAKVRDAAADRRTRVVVITLNPDSLTRLRRAARHETLTVVAVDPRYAERLERTLDTPIQLRFVPVADVTDVRGLDVPGELHVTLAARRVLGEVAHESLIELGPVLSTESARAVSRIVVEENIRRG